MAKSITYVDLDVHKNMIAVALAESGLEGRSARAWEDPNYADRLEGADGEAGSCRMRTAVLL
jgi:hypothetical protein